MRGGEEAFEASGDDEQGNDAGDQAGGLDAAAGDRVFPAQCSGKEHGVAEAESGGSGDEDGGQLEGAVGRDEAPQSYGHAVLAAGGGDDSQHDAVDGEVEEGSQAEDDAAGEGDKADGEVVGHDGAGGLGRDADDGVSPHLVALQGVDHGGAEKVAHELGAGGGEGGAEQSPGEGDEDRGGHVADVALEDDGILVAEKAKKREQIGFSAGIDDMVGASQQLIHMRGIGAGGRVLAEDGEIGGDLAVEQGHLPQLGAGKPAEAAGAGLGQQGREPVPVGPALENPLVGEDLRHGVEFRPA